MSKKNTFKDFWKYVNKTESCWLWTAGQRGKGYGVWSYRGEYYTAHRASYFINKGSIPENQHVLHKCDVRLCVNPDHLFLGTNADNVKDMMVKGRHKIAPVYGENAGTSKLTDKAVIEIRAKYKPRKYTQEMLAREYGVHQSVISRALHKKTWTHLK